MAGGVGSRFWPMSTSKFPKQFHDFLSSGRTLIQQTFDRMKRIAPVENIYVITNEEYRAITIEQLPELSDEQIVGEPYMMNTAACNLYMATKIHQKNPEAVLLISPSDHLILDEEKFVETVLFAMNQADDEKLITLGIEPTRPDTGYGYIQFTKKNCDGLCKVKTFTEKPNLELAETFVASGNFLWNAGIFIWKTSAFLKSFKAHQPEPFEVFEEIASDLNTLKEKELVKKAYSNMPKLSIDYALLEKANNVWVVPSKFGWSDLGTWGSLYENSKKDTNGNAVYADYQQLHNCFNNIITLPTGKAIVMDGLHDYIVVDTPNALLICPKAKEQEIKNYVNQLKVEKGERYI